jgi:hypothetical protein
VLSRSIVVASACAASGMATSMAAMIMVFMREHLARGAAAVLINRARKLLPAP